MAIYYCGESHIGPNNESHIDSEKLEKIFGVLMIFTACAMAFAFAHGPNDVANPVGPLAAVVGIVKGGDAVLAKVRIPFWITLSGASGIVTGLAMYGYRMIATGGLPTLPNSHSQPRFCSAISDGRYRVVIVSAVGIAHCNYANLGRRGVMCRCCSRHWRT